MAFNRWFSGLSKSRQQDFIVIVSSVALIFGAYVVTRFI